MKKNNIIIDNKEEQGIRKLATIVGPQAENMIRALNMGAIFQYRKRRDDLINGCCILDIYLDELNYLVVDNNWYIKKKKKSTYFLTIYLF